MDKNKCETRGRKLSLFCFFLVLSALFSLFLLLQIPSGNNSNGLMGFSTERLVMALCFVILAIFFFVGAIIIRFSTKQNDRLFHWINQNNKILRNTSFSTFVFFFFLLLIPDYRFHRISAYYLRLKPFFFFFSVSSFITFCFLASKEQLKKVFINKEFLRSFLIFLGIGLILIFLINFSGIGITKEKNLWNTFALPIQNVQLFAVFLAAFLLIYFFGSRLNFEMNKKKKGIAFFAIWIVAAVIWTSVPLQRHFFAPGPYAPEQQFFPYSDALSYDVEGQAAYYGFEYNFSLLLVKPTVTFVSLLTHLLTGNQMNASMLLQSILYAILPAILFLLASEAGGTLCGMLSAVFCICQEWNALNTEKILTIHSRLVMSEFLMQIIFVGFVYAVYKWIKHPSKAILYAALAGSLFTYGSYTRYTFLAFFPAMLPPLFIAFHKQIGRFLKSALVFLLAALITASPIAIRSFNYSGKIFPEFTGTFSAILLGQRFSSAMTPGKNEETAKPLPTEQAPVESTVAVIPTETTSITPDASTSIPTEEEKPAELRWRIHPVIDSILNHTVHNLITSLYVIPSVFTFEDEEHLFTSENAIWLPEWDGKRNAIQKIGATFILIVCAFALVYFYQKKNRLGLLIPYFWAVYALSIGVGTASGGRYIVPMNWVPILFLSVFCVSILNSFFPKEGLIQHEEQISDKTNKCWLKTIAVVSAFTAFFAVMVIFEKTRKAPDFVPAEKQLDFIRESLDDHSIDWDVVTTQVNSGIMNIGYGISIYPRFYYYKTGEHGSNIEFREEEYSRMIFTLLSDNSHHMVMPHTEQINDFPTGSTVYSLYCSNNGYREALTAIVVKPDGEIVTYKRDPLSEFSCPVNKPVCTEVEKCQ